MADIEIGPLTERLGDEEVVELAGQLEELGAPKLPKAADDSPHPIGEGIDDDVLEDFLERLDTYDLACEIYLPIEFDGRVEVGDLRVGSAVALLDILEEMKDDLGIEEEDDDDEDEEDDDEEEEILAPKLRHIWKLLFDGAKAAVERQLPLLLS